MKFDAQATTLTKTNVVFATKSYFENMIATWVPDASVPVVPPVIMDAVVGVPLEESPGHVLAEGPADATAAVEDERMD